MKRHPSERIYNLVFLVVKEQIKMTGTNLSLMQYIVRIEKSRNRTGLRVRLNSNAIQLIRQNRTFTRS